MNARLLSFTGLIGLVVLAGVLDACVRVRPTPPPPTPLPMFPAPDSASLTPASTIELPPPVTPSPQAYPPFAYPPQELTRLASLPTNTPWPTPTIGPTSTPYSTPLPPPTLIPTIDPALLPSLLSDAFRVEDIGGLNGHALKRVTGWEYGLRSTPYCVEGPYRWLDDSHLMMLPIVGLDDAIYITEYTQPIIVSMSTGRVWVPPTNGTLWGCRIALWSEPLQRLIATTQQEVVFFTSEGEITNRLPGGLPSGLTSDLAPSGLRLLTGAIWRNLATGQEVNFSEGRTFDPYTESLHNPSWSADETRLFSCCFHYADATTHQFASFSLPPLELPGRDGPGPNGIQNWWVLSDTYALAGIDLYESIATTFQPVIPLIDPVSQTYTDLGQIAGLQTNNDCPFIDIRVAPNLAHAAVRCSEMQVIDLKTLTVQPIFSRLDLVSWSPDGQYALFTIGQGIRWYEPIENGVFALWPVEAGDSYLITDYVIRTPIWRPDGKWLAYLSDNGQTFITLEAATHASRVVLLPQAFVSLAWNPLSNSLAVVAEDGSVWWVPDPNVDYVEQLTPPLPNVRDLRWSPSGSHLAFVSGPDVYVVEVTP